jgi:hypothetical protein
MGDLSLNSDGHAGAAPGQQPSSVRLAPLSREYLSSDIMNGVLKAIAPF